MFHYPFVLEQPYYALVNTDTNHEIGWLSREACKPGHVLAGESVLIVQANHEWSRAHADTPVDDALEELATLTASVVGDERLLEPQWTDHQQWRYAQPETGVPAEPLQQAERMGLYCVGDWVAGDGRVHAALRTGFEVGERMESPGE